MKWITNILKTYNKGLKYEELDFNFDQLSENYTILLEDYRLVEKALSEVEDEIIILYDTIETLENPVNQFKEYWYNKYSKKNDKKWNGISLKSYCTTKNKTVPKVTGSNSDDLANKALKKVHSLIPYLGDPKEYWQYADETVYRRLGDCEDGAILMYNIMITSGVPAWRIRLNAGNVQGGGHCYLTYLRESDNTWYVLDWCYWYKDSVNFKKKWTDAKKYFGVWFSWNEDYVWEEENQGRE